MRINSFQKLMLINAHPVKFLMNIVGGIIALYFLWMHEMLNAILIGGSFIMIGTLLSSKYSGFNAEEIAKTKMGKIFIQYSTVPGFVFYLTSHIVIPVSFWYHNLILTFVGIVILISGLVFRKNLI